MSRVEEIEMAIEKLAPQEFARLRSWLVERENVEWDRQMDDDGASGRLDFLFEEAGAENASGLLREWPSSGG